MVVYSGIGLSLSHSRRKNYIDATFKISWRGPSQRWFLVDMHIPLQWVNRHLHPLLIDNKRGEQEMTTSLAALVKWVAKLCDFNLRACHCTEEFTLRWIRPLGCQDKLAYECPRLAKDRRRIRDRTSSPPQRFPARGITPIGRSAFCAQAGPFREVRWPDKLKASHID
jgi:hypothetical protein